VICSFNPAQIAPFGAAKGLTGCLYSSLSVFAYENNQKQHTTGPATKSASPNSRG
jgi:hypothetical protein